MGASLDWERYSHDDAADMGDPPYGLVGALLFGVLLLVTIVVFWVLS